MEDDLPAIHFRGTEKFHFVLDVFLCFSCRSLKLIYHNGTRSYIPFYGWESVICLVVCWCWGLLWKGMKHSQNAQPEIDHLLTFCYKFGFPTWGDTASRLKNFEFWDVLGGYLQDQLRLLRQAKWVKVKGKRWNFFLLLDILNLKLNCLMTWWFKHMGCIVFQFLRGWPLVTREIGVSFIGLVGNIVALTHLS